MTLQEINKAYNRIVGSLDSKEFEECPSITLQVLLSGSREYSFQDKLNEHAGHLQIICCATGLKEQKIRCRNRYTTI